VRPLACDSPILDTSCSSLAEPGPDPAAGWQSRQASARLLLRSASGRAWRWGIGNEVVCAPSIHHRNMEFTLLPVAALPPQLF
jgi:hypothetical protein